MFTVSSRLHRAAGAAGGFACIGGGVDVESLAALLDDLEQGAHGLPKTILYTLNPADNAVMSVLAGIVYREMRNGNGQ